MAKKKSEAGASKSDTSAKRKAASPAKKSATSAAASEKQAKAAPAKPSKTTARPSTPPAVPMVDTNLAAQAAAQMLAAGFGRREQNQQTDEEKREGSLIRQLKADLNKGHAQTVSSVLDKGAPQGQKKSSGLPFGQKQVGRNQTFGADVTRSGVPRRTSG